MMNCSKETKPRFKEIIDEASLILLSSNNIQSFPFSVSNIIKEKTGIVCRSYAKGAAYGVDVLAFGTKDAIIQKYNNRYIIFYNDDSSIMAERKKYSLGHEFGHYVMKHDLDDKTQYDLFEIEANFFAAQLLMPEQIINELRKRGVQITKEYLQKCFGVSKQAAEKRIDTLRKIDYTKRDDEEKLMDEYIAMKFKTFIDEAAPNSNLFYTYDSYEEDMQNERNSWY